MAENHFRTSGMWPIEQPKTRAPFKDLFPIDPAIQTAICADMKQRGYDASKPIIVWGETVVCGHTRLAAAKKAGLRQVWVFCHEFADVAEALDYAIRDQRDRRNMMGADILRCVEALQGRWRTEAGRPEKIGSKDPISVRNADMAATLGVSVPMIKRAKTIIEHGDEETKRQVLEGEKSITRAAAETQEKRKRVPQPSGRPTFNRTNDKIEWAAWSWNPITGCKHGCPYCYARDIANRFYAEKFEPTYRPERLAAPINTKPIPPRWKGDMGNAGVFVCSMADLFGAWVPDDWIEAVMRVVRGSPQWRFIFLTKNPERLAEVEWPANAWVGATVDEQVRIARTEAAFRRFDATVKFVSCEPLRERVMFTDLSLFDWVIVGGQSQSSGGPAAQPDPWWAMELTVDAHRAGCKVYHKTNLRLERIREYPG